MLKHVLLILILILAQGLAAQGRAMLKVFPPTCEDCCNGRILLTDIQDCGVPDFSYDWLLSENQILSMDSIINLCSGHSSFVIHDASNEIDTVKVLLRHYDKIHEEQVSWDCFDSTSYNADIQFEAVMTHADTRDTLSGSEVRIYQEEKLFTRIITPVNDSFSTLLPLGHKYRLEFSRAGFFTKTLIIDAQGFDPWKVGEGYSVDTGVSMIEMVEGLELDILTEPMGYMYYDKSSDNFKWDWKYTQRMKEEVDVRLQDFQGE